MRVYRAARQAVYRSDSQRFRSVYPNCVGLDAILQAALYSYFETEISLFCPPHARGAGPRMKAQHRHELQQNQLADWLESSFEKLKPYASALVGVLVAVAIIIGVYMYVGAVERRNVTAAADQ